MTATEFQIASAIQPLTRAGLHICLAVQAGFEPEARPHRISAECAVFFAQFRRIPAIREFVRQ